MIRRTVDQASWSMSSRARAVWSRRSGGVGLRSAAGLDEPGGDVVQCAGRGVAWPSQGGEEVDGGVNRLERAGRRSSRQRVERLDGERGEEVRQVGLGVAEAAYVVVPGDLGTPGLVDGAHQAVGTLLGDQGDLDAW